MLKSPLVCRPFRFNCATLFSCVVLSPLVSSYPNRATPGYSVLPCILDDYVIGSGVIKHFELLHTQVLLPSILAI